MDTVEYVGSCGSTRCSVGAGTQLPPPPATALLRTDFEQLSPRYINFGFSKVFPYFHLPHVLYHNFF